MGTSYYHEREWCACCDRALDGDDNRVHIGKSSEGWTFSFHGTNEIRSWLQWMDRIAAGGRIVDEYGCVIPGEEFVKLVESKRKEKNNHTLYCRGNPRDREYAERNCWLDEQGNSFSAGEFS